MSAPVAARDYAPHFAGDLSPAAQAALIHLIQTLGNAGDARAAPVQAVLDQFLDAAGEGALKAEPARRYIQHSLENPNVIASRYFYKDASNGLEPDVRAALIALVVDRFFWEVWTDGPDG